MVFLDWPQIWYVSLVTVQSRYIQPKPGFKTWVTSHLSLGGAATVDELLEARGYLILRGPTATTVVLGVFRGLVVKDIVKELLDLWKNNLADC